MIDALKRLIRMQIAVANAKRTRRRKIGDRKVDIPLKVFKKISF